MTGRLRLYPPVRRFTSNNRVPNDVPLFLRGVISFICYLILGNGVHPEAALKPQKRVEDHGEDHGFEN